MKKAKDVAKEGPLTHLFKGYDLKALQVPQDAWPLENEWCLQGNKVLHGSISIWGGTMPFGLVVLYLGTGLLEVNAFVIRKVCLLLILCQLGHP